MSKARSFLRQPRVQETLSRVNSLAEQLRLREAISKARSLSRQPRVREALGRVNSLAEQLRLRETLGKVPPWCGSGGCRRGWAASMLARSSPASRGWAGTSTWTRSRTSAGVV
jgi:hypothetical protein